MGCWHVRTCACNVKGRKNESVCTYVCIHHYIFVELGVEACVCVFVRVCVGVVVDLPRVYAICSR